MSDFIDVRRGSIGSEAAPDLPKRSASCRPLRTSKASNLTEAIAHANGAAMLAAQAQSLANDDARAAQRSYTGRDGNTGNANMGAVIGGIIIGNILGGSMGGGLGGSMGGGWSSTS